MKLVVQDDHVLLLLGVIGFSDGHCDTFVPGSSVLHWDRSECISQKQLLLL